MSTTYVDFGVAGYYSFVWKTIVWSGESQGMSGNFMLKILNEPWCVLCACYVWVFLCSPCFLYPPSSFGSVPLPRALSPGWLVVHL